jgi:predicted TIM-barrel fold metal-dependent hydrolase
MKTATWDTLDRYVVISSDSHAGADVRDYRPYLPSAWHDRFDAWANSYESPFDDLIHATAHRNWNSDFRNSELDADGVAAELLFPNTVPPFFPTSALIVVNLPHTAAELEERWAGVQAHNRWMVDFVRESPVRRRGLAQIFPNDVDVVLDEIRWAHSTGAFGGVLTATVPPGHSVPGFFHERYEPLWRLCEELDMPIALHNVAVPDQPMDQETSKAMTLLRSGLWAQSTLIEMIVSGVFERYPRLKLVPSESGLWPLQVGQALDMRLPAMMSDAPNRTMKMFGSPVIDNLSLKPSEYVRRNVYYGLSGPVALKALFDQRDVTGVDHLLWGSDYPHEEGTTPQSKELIRWAFNDVPESETRLMLAGNMAEVYGFDLDALVPIAAEIGPSVTEVHTPITDEEYAASPNFIPEFVSRPFPGGALLDRQRDAITKF